MTEAIECLRRNLVTTPLLIFIAGFVGVAQCAETSHSLELVRDGWYSKPVASDPEGTLVPLLRVVANPENYHRKKIVVKGFLSVGMEANYLYLSREAYSLGLDDVAVYLEFTLEQQRESSVYRGSLVEIGGTLEVQRAHDGSVGSLAMRKITHLTIKLRGSPAR